MSVGSVRKAGTGPKARAVVIVALASLLAGCSPSAPDATTTASSTPDATTTASSAPDATSAASLAQVIISTAPIASEAPVYIGLQEGFFEDHGIELSVVVTAGAAEDAPLLQSGEIQFASMTLVSLAQAREAGVDIKMAGPPAAWSTGVPGDDFVGVYARPESGIESPADLAGKTVATNTLAGLGPMVIRNSVKVHGGDPAAVEFVEVGFPEMISVLENDQVDAIWLAEPFITMAEEAGFVPVAWPFQDVDPDSYPTAFLVTTSEFAENNAEVYDAFIAAYSEALAYTAANDDAVRASLPNLTGLSPELAEAITMPKFAPGTFTNDQIQPMADVIYEDGAVSEPLNLDEFYLAP